MPPEDFLKSKLMNLPLPLRWIVGSIVLLAITASLLRPWNWFAAPPTILEWTQSAGFSYDGMVFDSSTGDILPIIENCSKNTFLPLAVFRGSQKSIRTYPQVVEDLHLCTSRNNTVVHRGSLYTVAVKRSTDETFLVVVNADAKLQWAYSLGDKGVSSVILGENGTVYAYIGRFNYPSGGFITGTNKLLCLDPNTGAELCSTTPDSRFDRSMAKLHPYKGGIVIEYTGDGTLFPGLEYVDYSGKSLSVQDINGHGNAPYNDQSVNEEGQFFISSSDDNSIRAYGPSGKLWQYNLGLINVLEFACPAPSGVVIKTIEVNQYSLRYLNSKGQVLWERSIPYSSNIVVDGNRVILLATQDSGLKGQIIDLNGNPQFSGTTSGNEKIFYAPMFVKGNHLYTLAGIGQQRRTELVSISLAPQ